MQLALKELCKIHNLLQKFQLDALNGSCPEGKINQINKFLTYNEVPVSQLTAEPNFGPLKNLHFFFLKFPITLHTKKSPFCLNLQSSLAYHQIISGKIYLYSNACSDDKKNILSKKIFRLFSEFTKNIKAMVKAYLSSLSDFVFDENVIYFLLKNRLKLDSLYTKLTIDNWFKKSFKERSISSFLIDRYQTKGFSNIIPMIRQELFFHEGRNFSS